MVVKVVAASQSYLRIDCDVIRKSIEKHLAEVCRNHVICRNSDHRTQINFAQKLLLVTGSYLADSTHSLATAEGPEPA